MKNLSGGVRILLLVCLVMFGSLVAILLAVFPVRYRGARLSAWCTTLMVRVFNRIFGIRFSCTDPQTVANHHGLIFANHSTYLDPMALVHVAPGRFLAATEVRRVPGIGSLASAIETVFVDRGDKQSRRAARHSISSVLRHDPFPPIILFPEGRLGPGDQLMPFRYGAFELAVENQAPYLLCALHYNYPDIVTWHGGSRNEGLVAAVWRLATFGPGVTVELRPLSVTRPTAADDAALLATVAQRHVEQSLGMPPAPALIEEAPPAKWQRQ